MKKFLLKTDVNTVEVLSDRYVIITEIPNGKLVDSVLFESNDICIDQVPVISFYELFEFIDNDWVLIEKYKEDE